MLGLKLDIASKRGHWWTESYHDISRGVESASPVDSFTNMV